MRERGNREIRKKQEIEKEKRMRERKSWGENKKKKWAGQQQFKPNAFFNPTAKNIINTKANRVTIHVGYFKMWSHQNTKTPKHQNTKKAKTF